MVFCLSGSTLFCSGLPYLFCLDFTSLSFISRWCLTAKDKALFSSEKMLISFLFLHENICCGYSLEAPQPGASNEYPQHMFSWRNKKNIMRIPPLIYSYVSGCGKELNAHLECCLSEISHPRHIKIFHSYYTSTGLINVSSIF